MSLSVTISHIRIIRILHNVDLTLCLPEPTTCFVNQCVVHDAYCNKKTECTDQTDEWDCTNTFNTKRDPHPPPAVLHLNVTDNEHDTDLFHVDPLQRRTADMLTEKVSVLCPETHFQCPGNGYCLPVFMHCNNVVDCPGREDEQGCQQLQCPGFYRCRASFVCLHPSYLCDQLDQCPQKDDEAFCSLECPNHCTCYGLGYICRKAFPAWRYLAVRSLNAEGSGLTAAHLSNNTMLIHLNLANCSLRSVHYLTFPNLRSLDLSENLISYFNMSLLLGVKNLQTLRLSGNPLQSLFRALSNVTWTAHKLQNIDLSRTTLMEVDVSDLAPFLSLLKLNVSGSSVRRLYRSHNVSLAKLQVLDLSDCALKQFQHDALLAAGHLHAVFADSYKVCCPVALPSGFNVMNCQAPPDPLSSCHSLLGSAVYTSVVSASCAVAVVASVISFVYRVLLGRGSPSFTMNVYMTHLTVSDFGLGVCLAALSLADHLLDGRYVLLDSVWRRSLVCRGIGFVSLTTSHVSLFLVFVVTWDRLVNLMSALKPLRAVRSVGSHALCGAVWLGWGALSAALTLEVRPDHTQSSPTAACLLLPISPFLFPGRLPLFHAVVLLDWLLTACTLGGLGMVCLCVRRSEVTARCGQVSAACQVIHLCLLTATSWCTVCLLASLAWQEKGLKGAHVAVMVGVVPAVCAFRPCLYTMGAVQERWRRERLERLMAYVAAQRRHK